MNSVRAVTMVLGESYLILWRDDSAVQRRKLAVLLVELVRGNVPVDVACDPDAGMAQYPRYHLHLGAALQHLGCVKVAELVGRGRDDCHCRLLCFK